MKKERKEKKKDYVKLKVSFGKIEQICSLLFKRSFNFCIVTSVTFIDELSCTHHSIICSKSRKNIS